MGWDRTTESRWNNVQAELDDMRKHIRSSLTLRSNSSLVSMLNGVTRQISSNHLIDVMDAEALIKEVWKSVISVENVLANRQVTSSN